MVTSPIGVIVAARTGSARLPGKALKPLGGLPMVAFILRRLRATRAASQVVLATTDQSVDDALAACARGEGVQVFRGQEHDVVARYVEAAERFGFDYVVRVTGDCPFVDAESLDYFVRAAFAAGPFDLASTKGTFPAGIDYEMYQASGLAAFHHTSLDAAQREHLTKVYYDDPARFRIVRVQPRDEWRDASDTYTVDTVADYERACRIVDAFGRHNFTIAELVAAARVH